MDEIDVVEDVGDGERNASKSRELRLESVLVSEPRLETGGEEMRSHSERQFWICDIVTGRRRSYRRSTISASDFLSSRYSFVTQWRCMDKTSSIDSSTFRIFIVMSGIILV